MGVKYSSFERELVVDYCNNLKKINYSLVKTRDGGGAKQHEGKR